MLPHNTSTSVEPIRGHATGSTVQSSCRACGLEGAGFGHRDSRDLDARPVRVVGDHERRPAPTARQRISLTA
jgi:hypothetical protein